MIVVVLVVVVMVDIVFVASVVVVSEVVYCTRSCVIIAAARVAIAACFG